MPAWQAGVIGLPAPGVQVKLAPVGDKLEVRYRGPSITPGYWRQPELSREAFDDEGYFCSGDAASFIDARRPELGLRFDGRLAEDFKLSSGTWVNEQLTARAGGGSQRVVRALILDQPPSISAGEITDKGTINQRAVIECRRAAVEQLYSSSGASRVVVLS